MNERAWYRAWPPPKELRWSLRDNTNYMQTGALASLRYAARNRKELLMNFWQKGHNAIEAGKTRGVRGFVIPAAQRTLEVWRGFSSCSRTIASRCTASTRRPHSAT